MLNNDTETQFDIPENLIDLTGERLPREKRTPLSGEPVKVKVEKKRVRRQAASSERESENYTETFHTYITQEKAEVLRVYCMVHRVSVSEFLRSLLESAAGKMRDGITQHDIEMYRKYFGRVE